MGPEQQSWPPAEWPPRAKRSLLGIVLWTYVYCFCGNVIDFNMLSLNYIKAYLFLIFELHQSISIYLNYISVYRFVFIKETFWLDDNHSNCLIFAIFSELLLVSEFYCLFVKCFCLVVK